jgi:hypothetical protein
MFTVFVVAEDEAFIRTKPRLIVSEYDNRAFTASTAREPAHVRRASRCFIFLICHSGGWRSAGR